MEALGSKHRSAIFATAALAASVIFVPQSAMAENLLDFFSNLSKTNTQPTTKTEKDAAKIKAADFRKQNPPPADAARLKPNSVTRILIDARGNDEEVNRKIYILGYRDSSGEETLLKTIDGYKVGPGENGEQFCKKKEGDLKSPCGTYSISKNGDSKFGVAIHINYPTTEQVKQGYTGGAIMIHGGYPPGYDASKANNWTIGCFALPNWLVIQLFDAVRDDTTVTIEHGITPEKAMAKKFVPAAPPLVMAALKATSVTTKFQQPSATAKQQPLQQQPNTIVAKQPPNIVVAKAETPPVQPPQVAVQAPVEEPNAPANFVDRWNALPLRGNGASFKVSSSEDLNP